MAVNLLEKVYVIAPRSDKEKLLEELQKAGVLHVESDLKEELEEKTSEKEILTQEIDLHISQAEYVIDYLKKHEKKLTLAEKLEKARSTILYDDFKQIPDKFNLKSIYNEVYKLFRKSKELDAEENDLKNKLLRLEPYRDLRIDFEKIKDTHNVRMRVGTIGEATFKNFHLDLDDMSKAHTLFKIAEGYQQRDYFFLAYHKKYHEKIEKLLTNYNYRDEDLKITGTVREEIQKIQRRLEEIEKERKGAVEESILLADWLDRVKLLYDYLLSIRDRKKTESYLYETRDTFIIKGWARKVDHKKLEEIVSGVTDYYDITTKEPDEGEKVPVEMINPGYIEPMEFVTNLYGTPKYNERDPTGYIFPFFLLFFAICLTDAGYGVMLLILSLVLLKIFGGTKLIRVLLYGSVITLIAGFVSGGFWGIPFNDLPAFLTKYAINVNEKALEFLVFTLFLGIIQMVYGFFVGAKLMWERGELAETVERSLQGLFFGAGAPVVVMGSLLNKPFPEPVNSILVWISLLSGGVFLIYKTFRSLSKFKPTGSFLKKAFGLLVSIFTAVVVDSVLSLINAITSFLGAMLSYSRLMALGLATGGIGMVINLLAGLVQEIIPIPIVAPVLSVIILVFGHTFNLIISTLGAFVHTARLQYVEFFPYFFEGGGRKFVPFAIRPKYNVVTTANK